MTTELRKAHLLKSELPARVHHISLGKRSWIYIRIKWPSRKTSEINPGGPYFSAYIEIQFIPGKAVIFSHISVQSLGIPITQWFKKVGSLPSAQFVSLQV